MNVKVLPDLQEPPDGGIEIVANTASVAALIAPDEVPHTMERILLGSGSSSLTAFNTPT